MGLQCFGSGSKGNSYMLKIDNARILLDAGISHKKINIGMIELSKTDAMLISHEHL